MTSKVYLFAPVHTILPELNINAVVLGSLILMITAAKRYGGKMIKVEDRII